VSQLKLGDAVVSVLPSLAQVIKEAHLLRMATVHDWAHELTAVLPISRDLCTAWTTVVGHVAELQPRRPGRTTLVCYIRPGRTARCILASAPAGPQPVARAPARSSAARLPPRQDRRTLAAAGGAPRIATFPAAPARNCGPGRIDYLFLSPGNFSFIPLCKVVEAKAGWCPPASSPAALPLLLLLTPTTAAGGADAPRPPTGPLLAPPVS
jgi:hypothetical protein